MTRWATFSPWPRSSPRRPVLRTTTSSRWVLRGCRPPDCIHTPESRFSRRGAAGNCLSGMGLSCPARTMANPQNNGRIAHQEVDHVHFHMIPKPEGNDKAGLVVGWPGKFCAACKANGSSRSGCCCRARTDASFPRTTSLLFTRRSRPSFEFRGQSSNAFRSTVPLRVLYTGSGLHDIKRAFGMSTGVPPVTLYVGSVVTRRDDDPSSVHWLRLVQSDQRPASAKSRDGSHRVESHGLHGTQK